MTHYDYLVVGSGLFGSVFARCVKDAGRTVLVIERKNHIGGGCYSYKTDGIDIHAYGPHIFYSDDKKSWEWLNRFTHFLPCTISPLANYEGRLFNLPFNMNTFYTLWHVTTPKQAKEMLERQRIPCDDPKNLEEYALDKVGKDIYEMLIKGYVEKQYGKPCKNLPATIISRMPIRLTFDNDYNGKRYQGIPEKGWTHLFENLLQGIPVYLNTDYLSFKEKFSRVADRIIYTGMIDEYFDPFFRSKF